MSRPKEVQEAMENADIIAKMPIDERDCLDDNLGILAAYVRKLEAEIRKLRGNEQETYSDQKRLRLFDGSGIDYIRHRAEKHEKKYQGPFNKLQAQHLRRLAQELEDICSENERLKAELAEARPIPEGEGEKG